MIMQKFLQGCTFNPGFAEVDRREADKLAYVYLRLALSCHAGPICFVFRKCGDCQCDSVLSVPAAVVASSSISYKVRSAAPSRGTRDAADVPSCEAGGLDRSRWLMVGIFVAKL